MDRFDVFVAPWQLHVQAYTLPASAGDAQEIAQGRDELPALIGREWKRKVRRMNTMPC